ncbi:alpha/beta fold hydrolase [Actinomycetospora lemnae]|uniref:Alpha/beta fold hydrolase n=1 Tax=Actinomycetospora lemnae TaxID=3019891 RepID=A0ABT5SZC9_9PSEU|nr:alpha/beta fold hydrolase [Actinomycetospora sp. DW7H6]MDD7968217.1 alpha/beta fold hydrolase [Actinomycetospora sp. DW7H6]
MTAEEQPPAPTSGPSLPALTSGPARTASRIGENLWEWVTHGHLADTRRMPRLPVLLGEGYTVHRYEPTVPVDPALAPLLLVPPLGAPDFAFDLRRGASLVEDLLATGREIFIVTYDATGRGAGRRGLELWVDEILPAALYAVADEHDGAPVHLAGWSLGGLFTLLTAASRVSGAPVRSVTAFASPVDVAAVPLVAPFRSVAEYTGGRIFSTAYRTLGSFPATAVKWAFQLTSVERYLTKPVTLATHLDDRELLEQIEAVDLLMDNMTAYPGRAFGQIYHHVIRSNDLAEDRLRLAGRPVRLADVDVPVLLVAGADDVIAPVAAVERATELLTGSPDLRFVVRPGGHLGVLAGRRARENSWRDLEAFLADHDH